MIKIEDLIENLTSSIKKRGFKNRLNGLVEIDYMIL